MRKSLQPRRAFTLVELMVVMGIIALLAGLLLPMVFRSLRAGKRARMAADLQAIETGLNAYKTDFGDFPRFPVAYDPSNVDISKDRGARLLCRSLLGPGPADPAVLGHDGADGPGFRLRPGGLGKVWGPYIVPDKFHTTPPPGQTTGVDDTAKLLDMEGNVILYYPAKTGNVDIGPPSSKQGYCESVAPNVALSPGKVAPLYNIWDNEDFLSLPPKDPASSIRVILGDKTLDGVIDPTKPTPDESATTQAPYLLWCAGVDGVFGLTAKGYTDDVTNFDIPVGLFKN